MRRSHWIQNIALVAAVALSGCLNDGQTVQTNGSGTGASGASGVSSLAVPSGTSIDVTLDTRLTSESASVGDSWAGSVRNSSVVDGRNVIPAGSPVAGTVTGVKPAHKGDRAMLDLGLTSITVNGRSYRVGGTTEAIIAGSTRARNLGAIAGGVAAGALIGKAVSGSNKGTIIGGLIGGGAATGVVAASDGYQVVLKSGTPLAFTTSQVVAVRN